MTTDVTQYPSSPKEDLFDNEGDPSDNEVSPSVDTRPPLERETNIMTQGAWGSKGFEIVSTPTLVTYCLLLTEIEQQRFNQISGMLERGQFYPIKDVLCSKSFLRSFALDSGKMVSSDGDNAKEKPVGDVAHVASERVSPTFLEMTPPRLLGGNIWQPFLGLESGSPSSSSSSSSEAWSDPVLPLSSNWMGKQVADAEKKGPMPPLEDKKKKGPAAKASAKSKVTSSQATTLAAVSREGTSANPGVDLGLNVSVLENPRVAEKLI
ncbi:hypothetical protein Acr_14g0005820 [Actinidia rufa]|uniref:Uncharacterized protein n=1 Tax=Actinidia rufa TaxID=165716 RepID=A0A7J0FRC1_9ERIC|nr:hypothetical protein Acr_14g0005820 [Actinidia rufa]